MASRRHFVGSLLSVAAAHSIAREDKNSERSQQAPKPLARKGALVLSGGGIKGAFQAGALAEILSQGFRPSILVGTSIGALNAAFLADRAGRSKTLDWSAVGKELEDFWRDRITSPDCILDKVGKARITWDVLRKRFSGFVGIDPAKHIVRNTIQLDNVRASGLTVKVAAVNVVSGGLVLEGPESSNFIDYVIGSSAMPIIMPLVDIGGAPYTDGGLREVAPLQTAIDLGADDITCVVCQAKELAATNFNSRDLLQLARRLMDIITNETVTNNLERLKKESLLRETSLKALNQSPQRTVTVRIIRPADEINVDMESFTSQDIKAMIDTGHYAARGMTTRVDATLTVA
jgi:NTE family protein